MAKVAVIALVILAIGGIAYAAIPGPDGVIHGCYKTADGKLRVIDDTATCADSETALNWNQTGLQGPAGITTTYTVRADGSIPANGSASVVASCNSGDAATGGGYNANGSPLGQLPPLSVERELPLPFDAPISWRVDVSNSTASDRGIIVYVVCSGG